MSQLLEKIKKDQLEARKAKDKVLAKLLTTLIGEASPSGNGVIDNNAVKATITKFLKNARITNNIRPSGTLNREISILESYLPEVLQGFVLEAYIGRLIEKLNVTSARDIGKIMSKLSQADYTINKGEAHKLIKKLFALKLKP